MCGVLWKGSLIISTDLDTKNFTKFKLNFITAL